MIYVFVYFYNQDGERWIRAVFWTRFGAWTTTPWSLRRRGCI